MVARSLTVVTSVPSTNTLKLPRVDDFGPTIANERTLVTVIVAAAPVWFVYFSVPPDALLVVDVPQVPV